MSVAIELSQLHWVVLHGRGVFHTGDSTNFVKILATAALSQDKESIYYMRYDDSPERNLMPMIHYVVIGNPKIEILPPEELEPIGEIFEAIGVLDSSMLTQKTSQRALLFDGAKPDAVLVINSTLPADILMRIVKKYVYSTEWRGKLVSIYARRYDSDLSIGMIGGLLKAWNIIPLDSAITALESLGMGGKANGLQRAFQDAVVLNVI